MIVNFIQQVIPCRVACCFVVWYLQGKTKLNRLKKFKQINNRLRSLGLIRSFCRPINMCGLILKINNRWTPASAANIPLAPIIYFSFFTFISMRLHKWMNSHQFSMLTVVSNFCKFHITRLTLIQISRPRHQKISGIVGTMQYTECILRKVLQILRVASCQNMQVCFYKVLIGCPQFMFFKSLKCNLRKGLVPLCIIPHSMLVCRYLGLKVARCLCVQMSKKHQLSIHGSSRNCNNT